jgi:hypothetical protein
VVCCIGTRAVNVSHVIFGRPAGVSRYSLESTITVFFKVRSTLLELRSVVCHAFAGRSGRTYLQYGGESDRIFYFLFFFIFIFYEGISVSSEPMLLTAIKMIS